MYIVKQFRKPPFVVSSPPGRGRVLGEYETPGEAWEALMELEEEYSHRREVKMTLAFFFVLAAVTFLSGV